MSATIPMNKTATPEPARRGFACPCIKCGEANTLRMEIDNVGAFTCTSCDAEFGLEDVEALIALWQPLLAWCKTAPEYVEE